MTTGIASQPKPRTVTCAECGCESPLAEFFVKTSKGMLCPNCVPKETGRNMLLSYGALIVLGVFLSVVASGSSPTIQWAPLLNLLLCIVVLWLTIIAHEGIHGVTALLLRGRVFEMALGAGRIRYRFKWRGIGFSLRKGLFLGLCLAGFPQRSWIRTRLFIYISAPLVVQSLLVLWLLPRFDFRTLFTRVAVVETVVIVNLFIIATNLFPRRVSTTVSTDGAVLLDLLRGRTQPEAQQALYYLLESARALDNEDYPAMLAAAETSVALDPENKVIKNQLAVAYLYEERYAEALAFFDQFLAEEAPAPSAARGMYQCNRAAVYYQLAMTPTGVDGTQLAEAHAAASEAFFLFPWSDPVRVERAVDQYYQGNYQLSLDLLQRELPLQVTITNRAGILARLALAQHALAQREAAYASIDEAWRIYPKGGQTMRRVSEIVGYPVPAEQRNAERMAVDD